MKKLNLITIGLLTTPVFAADFVITINNNQNDYEVGGFTTTTIIGEWSNSGEVINCQNPDITGEDIYIGQTGIQTWQCKQPQTATKTITKIYDDGSEDISTEILSKNIDSTKEEIINGTLVLSSCKEIFDNQHSNGDGNYQIKPLNNQFEAYCDMTTDEGGWTRIVYQGNVFGSSDYKNEINALWGDGLDKFLKYENHGKGVTMYYNRITATTYDFYENTLRTWRSYGHTLGSTFNMNHNYNNLKSGVNNFAFCNYSDEPVPEHTTVGFPRDCGQSGAVGGQWIIMDEYVRAEGYTPFTTYNSYYTLWIK